METRWVNRPRTVGTCPLRHIFFSIKPPLHMNVILIYYGCCEWKATNDVLWQLGVDLDFSKVLACSHCMTCLGLRCFILSQGNANCDENHSQAHFQMESMTEETLERDVVVYVRGYCWVVARVGYDTQAMKGRRTMEEAHAIGVVGSGQIQHHWYPLNYNFHSTLIGGWGKKWILCHIKRTWI